MTRSSVSNSGSAKGGKHDVTYLRALKQVTDVGITQTELGKVVGASSRTIQNWASGDVKPSGSKAQRLLDVQMIVDLLDDVYTEEGIQIWLNARNRNLELQRPIDLLTAGKIDEVLEEASALAGGF